MHFIAADEYRKNFALARIDKKAKKTFKDSSKIKEITLPGAHADVGGGYMDKEDNPRYIADNDIQRLLEWNKKYEWIDVSSVDGVEDVETKKDIKRKKKTGFYRIKHWYTSDNLFMYRPKVSNKYEYVTLKLMYNEARNAKSGMEKVPFDPISSAYEFKKCEFLNEVYEELKNDRFDFNGDNHKQLRQNYLHHSADLDGIAPLDVNAPSMHDYHNEKDEIYGKRVIYNVKA